MRIVSDIFAYTSKRMPKFNSISISGYHMQEAGATADLELGYTLADGIEYVRAGVKAGMDVDAFAPRLSFFWAIGMNFFMEIAKMRAGRLLWAKLMAEEFKPKDPRSLALRTHCQTSGLEPRRAGRIQQCSADLRRGHGGDARPYPVAAHQRARRGAGAAHRFLRAHRPQHPADVAAYRVRHDAYHRSLGGSFYVERLTHDLAARALKHLEEVEKFGGMAKAIEAGIPKRMIEQAATATQGRMIRAGRPSSA